MKLNKSSLDGLTCPAGRKDMMVFDDELDGFAVRVTAKGTVTFLLQYRRGTLTRRLTLGRYGQITPAQARRLAEAARGEVAAGRDPVAVRDAEHQAEAEAAAQRKRDKAAEAFTLAHLIDAWAARQLAGRSDRYQREAPRALRNALAGLLALPADSITVDQVQRALDARTKPASGAARQPPAAARPSATGAVMARRTRAYGRTMFNWGIARRLVTANPFAAAAVDGREVARDRALTGQEVGEAWRAAGRLGWPWGPYFRFLLLTLQRAAETAGLRWTELSEDLAVWELPGPRAKNGRPHTVHLAEPARAILRELRAPPGQAEPVQDLARVRASTARPAGSPFVFSTTGRTAITGYSHAKRRLDAAIAEERAKAGAASAALPPPASWRLHDFRRTGVTVLASLGVGVHVADKLLNHATGALGGVAAVYQRYEFMAERKAALETWAAYVLRMGEGRQAGGNVVDLRPREAGEGR